MKTNVKLSDILADFPLLQRAGRWDFPEDGDPLPARGARTVDHVYSIGRNASNSAGQIAAAAFVLRTAFALGLTNAECTLGWDASMSRAFDAETLEAYKKWKDVR